MHEHVLLGCRPVPLASYLKALGVLRLVGEQADPVARGAWQGEAFLLDTELDEEALQRFFLEEYRPTPVVAPWNGGSGFFAGDNRQAVQRIAASPLPRFQAYREAILAAEEVLASRGMTAKPEGKEAKATLLDACRGRLPDRVLPWLDAAYLMTANGPKYPPLLGTGGNDGRLDFTNNFMQRLLDVVHEAGAPAPDSAELLRAALYDAPTSALGDGAIGQFLPSGVGGVNAGVGFDGEAQSNPWDFVLMIEGAATFSAAAVRRMALDTEGALSYPFTVHAAAAGYASVAASDAATGASRGEMWLPLWRRRARYAEVHALFAEGRARVSGRSARTGIDFARAVATLGVDRGFTDVQRYGFQVRNGLSYLAMPIERLGVRERPSVRRLDEIDGWLGTLRRRAAGDRTPASIRRAAAMLDEAILDLCRRGGADRVQSVLVALGGCERALARSLRWAMDPMIRVPPVPPLSPAWLLEADDGSAEFRLAVALASVAARDVTTYVPLRRQMEPVTASARRDRLRVTWDQRAGRDVVWHEGPLPAALNAILARRLVTFHRAGGAEYPDRGAQPARLSDVAAFVEGRTDDARLAALLWGAALVDWPRCAEPLFDAPAGGTAPPALYGLLKACFPGGGTGGADVPPVRLVPRIHRLATSGDGAGAARAAAQRLRASGFEPSVTVVHQRGDEARRIAAALLFPLSRRAMDRVRRAVLRPVPQPGETPA
jgi:CRISPR-associated protein Csx17